MLRHGADVSIKDANGSTALHYACRYHSKRQHSAPSSSSSSPPTSSSSSPAQLSPLSPQPTQPRSAIDQQRMVTNLIGSGATVNSSDSWGWTALHYAVMRDLPLVVEVLLQKGRAEPNGGGSGGPQNRTPLHVACQTHRRHSLEIALTLLSHRAFIDVQDRQGATAFHYAYEAALDDVALELIRRGADPRLSSSFLTSRDTERQQSLLAVAVLSIRPMLLTKRGARVQQLPKNIARRCFGALVRDRSGAKFKFGVAIPNRCSQAAFGLTVWKYHCFLCGYIYCDKCLDTISTHRVFFFFFFFFFFVCHFFFIT